MRLRETSLQPVPIMSSIVNYFRIEVLVALKSKNSANIDNVGIQPKDPSW